MATFKELGPNNIKSTSRPYYQLTDILASDISSTAKRRTYEMFTTGREVTTSNDVQGFAQVTSGLFQTVHDRDFTLQTANALMDITFGFNPDWERIVPSGEETVCSGTDSRGNRQYPDYTLMVREKTDVYRQMAQLLLGDASAKFTRGVDGTTDINIPLFIPFKSIVVRDRIVRNSFAMKFYRYLSRRAHASYDTESPPPARSTIGDASGGVPADGDEYDFSLDTYDLTTRVWVDSDPANLRGLPILISADSAIPLDEDDIFGLDPDDPLYGPDYSGTARALGDVIVTDIGANVSRRNSYAGEFGDLVLAAATDVKVGMIFYDVGIVVVDASVVFDMTQKVVGQISGMVDPSDTQYRLLFDDADTTGLVHPGYNLYNAMVIDGFDPDNPGLYVAPYVFDSNATTWYLNDSTLQIFGRRTFGNRSDASVVVNNTLEDFFIEGSMDDVLNHVCGTRFGNTAASAAAYKHVYVLNSTILNVELEPDEFNYSSNPTYTDTTGRIVVIEPGRESEQRSFVYVTTVALYDENDGCVAVGKLSRPLEKSDEKKLSITLEIAH